MPSQPAPSAEVVVAVAVGGVVGALARHAVGLAVPHAGGYGPLGATLAVNLLGSGVLGVLVGRSRASAGGPTRLRPLVHPFLGVGVLGSFTTFSTFSAGTWSLLVDGEALVAGGYALATLAGCTSAAALGSRWARRPVAAGGVG